MGSYFHLQSNFSICTVGNFHEKKILWIGRKYDFHGENFRELLTGAAK